MTILGRHTIAETKSLLNLMEWRIDNWNDVVAGLKRAEPETLDKDATLVRDWNAFLERWVSAKTGVRAKYVAALIANPLLGPEMIPDEDGYQALLHASSATYPLYTPTDLPGLQQRISKLHPERKYDFGDPPKDFSLDLDLQAYKAADSAAKGIEKAKEKAQESGKDFLADNYGKIAIVGGGAIATLIVLRKLHLL
jgi:hypothetical protein